MRYDDDVKLEARRLYVEEGWTPGRISEHMGGNPTAMTIYNWIKSGQPEGEHWDELRKEHQAERYSDLSPVGFARGLMDRMHKALQSGNADELSKYNAAFRDLVDPKYRYGITMEVLTRFLEHVRDHRPEAFQEIELAELAKSFRRQEKKRLDL